MSDAREPSRAVDAVPSAADGHDETRDELAETAERIACIEAMPLGERAGAYGEVADELRRALENADPASS